jgi:hypothetical protein
MKSQYEKAWTLRGWEIALGAWFALWCISLAIGTYAGYVQVLCFYIRIQHHGLITPPSVVV